MMRIDDHRTVFGTHLHGLHRLGDDFGFRGSDAELKGFSHMGWLGWLGRLGRLGRERMGSLPIVPYFLFLRIMPFHYFIDRSSEVEVLLRDVVVLPIEDFSEAADGVFELDVLPFDPRELLRHVEVL